MTLHTPHRDTGSSRYCGPAAIMCVTGERGSLVSEVVRSVRAQDGREHKRRVTGMSNADLIATMSAFGWQVVEEWHAPDSKLSQRVKIPDPNGKWHDGHGGCFRYERKRPEGFKPHAFANFLSERGSGGPYIVNVTGHYMAVSQGEVCDSGASVTLPIDISAYLKRRKTTYRRSWVWHWWRFARDVAT